MPVGFTLHDSLVTVLVLKYSESQNIKYFKTFVTSEGLISYIVSNFKYDYFFTAQPEKVFYFWR